MVSRCISPERHVFSLPSTLGGVAVSFKCSAWRYPASQAGVTLILAHGISGHKEQYHPTIARLLSFRDSATYQIREIWLIDFPNHGETATMNRPLLDEHKANNVRQNVAGTCTLMDVAAYLHAFLSLSRFQGHTIIGMGHSGGCTAWIHALTKFTPIYLNGLILVEPTLMFPSLSPTDSRSIHGAANVRGAYAKRDKWATRTEFRRWIAKNGKSIWTRWDPRVLHLFVEHGFEEVTSEGRDSYITPRLRKDEEAPMYECLAHTIEPWQLAAVCTMLNENGRRGMHVMWAESEEFVSKTARAEMLEAAEHRVTTQRVLESGHLVPQLKPEGLGDAMHEVLGLIGSDTKSLL